jgi:hypothetical protein
LKPAAEASRLAIVEVNFRWRLTESLWLITSIERNGLKQQLMEFY